MYARVGALIVVGVTVALGGLAQAQAVAVSVDATAPGTPLERVWAFHGYDEINYTTSPEGQTLLGEIAAAHTVPPHIRSHFLFNTGDGVPSLKWGSTNVYTEDAAGNPVYDFTITDGILDALTGAGTLPFVELGFMPQALTSATGIPYQNSGVYTLDGGCLYPPRDYTKWSALIQAWAMHAQARYPGLDDTWLWELWNEPNLGYWHGTLAEYETLYDYTESALHQVLPNAQLGGPAVSGPGAFLTEFLQHCASGTDAATGGTGARLDLITFHAKGGVSLVGGHVEMDMGNQLGLHQTGFSEVAGSAFAQTPIYVTEADPDGCAACPVSMVPADAYRTSPAYGAYEIEMMKRSLELEARAGVKLGGLLTWAFTFPGTPYFAGYRALATNGIDLPVMAAFRLLGALAGARLPVTSSGALALDDILANGVRAQADVDAMATFDGTRIQVLVWNYHDDLVDVASTPVHLSVRVPATFGLGASLTHARVDSSNGDAYTTWLGQGSPTAPSPTQIAALKGSMAPVVLTLAEAVPVTGGTVTVDFTLPRFGVSLLTLEPLGSPPDAGTGPRPTSGGGCACRTNGADGANGAVWTLCLALLVLAIRSGRCRS
ncbi:MAG TPA: beta-xylosidase [Polyangia bacterium]|nr:beta-xylosidase [Polyangia bacterium]